MRILPRIMRVLHFINTPFSIEQLQSGGAGITTPGGWITSLVGRMLQERDIYLACAAFGNKKKKQTSSDKRITCFEMPRGWRENDKLLVKCRDVVNEWKPDLIHIHGTEESYGLLTARGLVKCPTVISLQGLLGPCSEWYHYFGNRSLVEIIKMHRFLEIPALRGNWIGFLNIRKAAKREKEIIQGNHFFMGRTAWDKAYINALNPNAQYFSENRMLREAFWQTQWNMKNIQRHRIIFTNPGRPRKGTEILLDAVKLLQHQFPNIKVYLVGTISRRSGYGRYLRKLINSMNGVAIELGALNAQQMTEELAMSHVFVSPSFIDNSPNAVSEAQLMGMPVISTYTGGVPSLIEDGQTGLFFQTGDAPMLAARLREIFENDELTVRIGSRAREIAVKRHDPDMIVKQVLSNYNAVLKYYEMTNKV